MSSAMKAHHHQQQQQQQKHQQQPSSKPPPSRKPSSSSSTSAPSFRRKSRWEPPPSNTPAESADPKPKPPLSIPSSSSDALLPGPASNFPPSGPALPPFALPEPSSAGRPPPPAYGFHNLERRTIVLADGSVRSYFALPPDEYPPVDAVAAPEWFLPPLGADGPRRGPEPGRLEVPFHHHSHFPPSHANWVSAAPDMYHRGGTDGSDRGAADDYRASLGIDGRGAADDYRASLKRRFEHDERLRVRDQRDELLLQNQHQPSHYTSNYVRSSEPDGLPIPDGYAGYSADRHPSRDDSENRPLKYPREGGVGEDEYGNLLSRRGFDGDNLESKSLDLDPEALKRAFLGFSKSLNESASQRKKYLEEGKHGSLHCLACGRDSKDYADVHSLIMHAYNSSNSGLRASHLGLHKALCVLMGWNYLRAPDNSKAYQSLPADKLAANKADLIIWPPIVIIHNTNLGRRKDGRMDGMGNKEMDTKLRDLGFGGGKSKSLYGKDGHLGITIVRFANNQSGLREAENLAEYFERDNHGRNGWAHAQPSQQPSEDDEKLVKVADRTRTKKKILYGYLGTASDLDKVDFDLRKKAVIKSRRELDISD